MLLELDACPLATQQCLTDEDSAVPGLEETRLLRGEARPNAGASAQPHAQGLQMTHAGPRPQVSSPWGLKSPHVAPPLRLPTRSLVLPGASAMGTLAPELPPGLGWPGFPPGPSGCRQRSQAGPPQCVLDAG